MGDDAIEDETLKQQLQPLLQRNSFELREHGIRRVTIVLFRKGQCPGYFTFREATDYTKDQTIRHIEPAMAYQLELTRLSNLDILNLVSPTIDKFMFITLLVKKILRIVDSLLTSWSIKK